MESCIRISLSEYIDPDQSQRFDHSGRNEIWREPFPPARACDDPFTMSAPVSSTYPNNALMHLHLYLSSLQAGPSEATSDSDHLTGRG